MKKNLILLVALMLLPPGLARGVTVTPEETAAAKQWMESRFNGTELPFSFVYGGQPSAEMLKTWKLEKAVKKLDDRRNEHTVSYTDPKTGLVVRCVAIEYLDFPTIEWTVFFKNTGAADSPILENIQGVDLRLARSGEAEFVLHHSAGAVSTAMDYAPQETVVTPGASLRYAPNGGRPANGAWPYYNLQWDGGGMILVIGWPGQWASLFVRDAEKGMHVTAGQELTHLKLRSGEEIRGPRVVVQLYRGDFIRSQNVWRRWMMAHNMPRPGGKLPKPMLLAFSGRMYNEMCKADEANQIMCIDRYLEEGIGLDYWWMDAGWYPCDGNWWKTGTWEVDTKRFPRGLRAISDYAHSKKMKTVLWFEPERVQPGTWLFEKHPQWLLGGTVLDLGNPEAQGWLTDHVDRVLTDQGIDLYRQDFNMEVLDFWRKNDPADRRGITENKHVTGYLAYWDELARRHPDMLIDSCSSGGRRNELEAMRRAVPLWRSDWAYPVVANQCMTHGISLWIPYYGTGVTACASTAYHGTGLTPVEPYAFWSTATPAICLTLDIRVKEIDYAALRSLVKQWRSVNRYYYGDFYPLLPYNHDSGAWTAWQFHDPESDEGMVQAFRRDGCPYESARLKLNDLKADSRYVVTDAEGKSPREMLGAELMSAGLPIEIADKPGVAVLVYKRVQ